MTDVIAQLRKALKTAGYNITEARRTVFDVLQDSEPQTMQQIVRSCPSINQTSVYRTINLFEKLGIVQKLQIGWKYKIELTDDFHEHHHHLTCLRCGLVIPFDEEAELTLYFETIARQHDFDIRGHQLEIQGYCSSCQPKFA